MSRSPGLPFDLSHIRLQPRRWWPSSRSSRLSPHCAARGNC